MNRLFLCGLLSLALIPPLASAQSDFVNPPGQTFGYTNSGSVANQMIDAVHFVNYGTFVASSVLPFESYNTLDFVNQGTMISVGGGWRFNHNSNRTGLRSLASSFVNLNPGFIEARDVDNGPSVPIGILGEPCSVSRLVPSYMQIWATNITIGGGGLAAGSSLRVGANGILDLKGQNVDLSYGGLEVLPLWDEVTGTILYSPPFSFTNFVPDVGIFDKYFGQASFSDIYGLNIIGLWDGTVAQSPGLLSPPILPPSPTGTYPGLQLPLPLADANIAGVLVALDITNSHGDPDTVLIFSNEVKQAVFVVAPSAFGVTGGFTPGNEPNNNAMTIGVSLSTRLTNSVTGVAETAYVNLRDTLASDSRIRGVSANLVGCGDVTGRPQNYVIDRQPIFSIGNAGNFGYPDPTFFLDSGITNFLGRNGIIETNILFDFVTNFSIIQGDYSAYSMFVANQVSRPPAITGSDITNLPGRITISADRLDLTQTRMRAEGHILIDTPRLISSTNAVIDCENLSFNVSSPTGNLKVQSLIPPNVPRLRGTINAWSAVWSNTVMMIIENYGVSNEVTTNVPPQTNTFIFFSPLTNLYGVTYHTLMLDASGLQSAVPVSVYGFTSRSRDLVMNDSVSVVESLFISGRSLTVNSSLRLSGIFPPDPVTGATPPVTPLSRWISTNAPNLQFFTNNGLITIATDCHFGDDRVPYSDFINNSNISAQSIAVGSDYFENNGVLLAFNGSLLMNGGTGKLQNGASTSANLSQFMCDNLKFDNYTLAAGGALTFYVTNSLNDAGYSTSSNLFMVNDGFNLMVKPSHGDLLGSALASVAPVDTSLRINHTWAAEDRGPTTAGFADNAAIGQVVLSAPTNNALFVFSGTTGHNALYVDLLDLSGLADYTNQLRINPSLTIYFAAARLASSVILPASTQPEEYLDGQFGGRLRWVPSFAGPNSTADVVVTNAAGDLLSVPVNYALRNSLIIDSDGDGLANGLQPGYPGPAPILPASLNLHITGHGTVSPDLSGQVLVAGQEYGLVAQPADGFTFTGWADAGGKPITNSPLLTFVMPVGGTNLTANFEFDVAPTAYSGLFYEPDPIGIEYGRSGAFALNTTKNGRFSGSLQLGNHRYSFSGKTDTNGAATVALRNTSLTLQFQIGASGVSGTVSEGTNWAANLLGGRNGFTGGANKAPFAGKYTIVFLGSQDLNDTAHPLGDGYGSVNVDASGRVRFSGVLADGTKVTQTTRVTDDQQWPFYVAFPNGKGQILSWLTFSIKPGQDIGGAFDWIKQPDAKTALYPGGFDFQADSIGSAYDSGTNPVTGFTSGALDLIGGDLTSPVMLGLSVSDKNKIVLSDKKAKFSLNRGQGLFSGSVPDPGNTRKSIKFKGAILQKQASGSGYFLGPTQSGRVSIGP